MDYADCVLRRYVVLFAASVGGSAGDRCDGGYPVA